MIESQKEIKELLFQEYTKLEENEKIEKSFKKDAGVLIAKQKLSKIDSFTGYFEFLHNNYKTPVYFEGLTYPSVTHAFLAAKSTDEKTRKAILNAETFQILSNIALRIEIPKDWELRKIKIMEQLIRDKFRRNSELQEKLKLTKDRELIMIYDEPIKSNFDWGIVKGKGQNQLGRILMKIREDLLQDKICSPNPLEILNWINTSFKLVDEIQFFPEIKLTLTEGNNTRNYIILQGKNLYKIGQFSQYDLNLTHSSISNLHAVIITDQSMGILLIDLKSKFGTKLDDKILLPNIPYKLKSGNRIHFGEIEGDFIVDIDFSKVKVAYLKEKQKIKESLDLLNKLNTNSKDVLIKTLGLSEINNETNDTIYIKNIPFIANENVLKNIFQENFGEVVSLYWPYDSDKGFRTDYAFIKFADPKSAKQAVDFGLVSYENPEKESNSFENKNYILKVSYSTSTPRYDKIHNNNYTNISNSRNYRSRSRNNEDNIGNDNKDKHSHRHHRKKEFSYSKYSNNSKSFSSNSD